jgi:hypothetical protein
MAAVVAGLGHESEVEEVSFGPGRCSKAESCGYISCFRDRQNRKFYHFEKVTRAKDADVSGSEKAANVLCPLLA